MSELPPVPPAGPTVPPTARYAAPALPVAPVWPLAIGIICIVFGAGGVMVGLFGLVSFSVFSSMTAGMQSAPQVIAEMQRMTILTSAVNTPISALLLAVGIGLAKRRRWSLPLARGWAVLRMVAAVVSVVAGVMVQSKQLAFMSSQGAVPPGMGRFTDLMAFTGVLFGLAWAWALPVFLLVWLGREKIRGQTREWA